MDAVAAENPDLPLIVRVYPGLCCFLHIERSDVRPMKNESFGKRNERFWKERERL